jgi:hypothetical protein
MQVKNWKAWVAAINAAGDSGQYCPQERGDLLHAEMRMKQLDGVMREGLPLVLSAGYGTKSMSTETVRRTCTAKEAAQYVYAGRWPDGTEERIYGLVREHWRLGERLPEDWKLVGGQPRMDPRTVVDYQTEANRAADVVTKRNPCAEVALPTEPTVIEDLTKKPKKNKPKNPKWANFEVNFDNPIVKQFRPGTGKVSTDNGGRSVQWVAATFKSRRGHERVFVPFLNGKVLGQKTDYGKGVSIPFVYGRGSRIFQSYPTRISVGEGRAFLYNGMPLPPPKPKTC